MLITSLTLLFLLNSSTCCHHQWESNYTFLWQWGTCENTALNLLLLQCFHFIFPLSSLLLVFHKHSLHLHFDIFLAFDLAVSVFLTVSRSTVPGQFSYCTCYCPQTIRWLILTHHHVVTSHKNQYFPPLFEPLFTSSLNLIFLVLLIVHVPITKARKSNA